MIAKALFMFASVVLGVGVVLMAVRGNYGGAAMNLVLLLGLPILYDSATYRG